MFRAFEVNSGAAVAAAPHFAVGVPFFGAEKKSDDVPRFEAKTNAFCEAVAATITNTAEKLAGIVLPQELAGKFSAFARKGAPVPRNMQDKDLIERSNIMTLQDIADQFCTGSLSSARVRMTKPDAPVALFESASSPIWDAEMVEFYMTERPITSFVRQHARECMKMKLDEKDGVVSIMTEAAPGCNKMGIEEAAHAYWNSNKPALLAHLRSTGLIHKRDHEGKYLTSHLVPKKRASFVCGTL